MKMKKTITTIILCCAIFFMFYPHDSYARKKIVTKVIYNKNNGRTNDDQSVTYNNVNSKLEVEEYKNFDLIKITVDCNNPGGEPCRRNANSGKINLDDDKTISSLLDNKEEELLNLVDGKIKQGELNGSMTKKVSVKSNNTKKTFQFEITWTNCDKNNNNGTVFVTIQDVSDVISTNSTKGLVNINYDAHIQ